MFTTFGAFFVSILGQTKTFLQISRQGIFFVFSAITAKFQGKLMKGFWEKLVAKAYMYEPTQARNFTSAFGNASKNTNACFERDSILVPLCFV